MSASLLLLAFDTVKYSKTLGYLNTVLNSAAEYITTVI